MSELTHTVTVSQARDKKCVSSHTLFSDQGVIAIVGVVGITRRSRAAITQGAEVELCRWSTTMTKLASWTVST